MRQKEFDSAQEAKKEAERLEKKAMKDRDNAVEHEESMLNRRIYLEAASASCLQVPVYIYRAPLMLLQYPSHAPQIPLKYPSDAPLISLSYPCNTPLLPL